MASPEIFDIPIGKVVGPPGNTGNGISGIELLSTSGLQKTYRINMTNETHFDFVVTDGNGISGASFNAETNELTITFDNGTSFTTPSLKGAPGNPGDDGYSPTVTIETITGGHRVTITDKTHPTGQSFDVMDGASDAGSVSYDPEETYQSGTVGAELQHQSRQLNDETTGLDTKAPVILETASGAIASFDDGADSMPIRKIVATIVPVQSGTGDQSPDNVRPISGWTGANIYNEETYDTSATPKLTINWQTEAGTIYGSTVTLNEDGSADVYVPIYGYHIMPSQWTWQAPSRVWVIDRTSLTPRYKYYGDNADGKIKVVACDKYVPYSFNYQANYSVAIREYNAQWLALKTDGTNTVTPEECTVLLELETPQTYHFDNVGELYTFLGTNNVWIDTGAITECDYPADTKLYIDGITAPDEDMIADANIASGKYFVVNNQLYLSTAAIAAGASIVPGTNCTATNLAEALNALNT